ncbi:uncharacterized protein LOC116181822 isoform X2 [Photinus pyralis]|nr:uncharacterized protein LOC116162286 isoform X2 [Photinus pyralis]XP_031331752.1 uncharacterized protein LOC116162286 isoform X2 [Photinus pyralis]XP_031358109.1 uncharacterized protein LOC116181822 isoform X2 [Photinus pyralis]XP_031358110.1 uncharacterized protein LOC116181822 isoform X2 [Photinus pyralis]
MEVRRKYSEGLKDLFSKYIKQKIKKMEMDNICQSSPSEKVPMPSLHTPPIDGYTAFNDKTVANLKNSIKEQIFVLKIHNQNKNCSTAQIMDQL